MSKNSISTLSLLILLLIFTSSYAGSGGEVNRQSDSRPEIGDPAPDFQGMTDQGDVWSSADYEGQTLVVFFFPAAMTGGCTAQACSFRDNRTQLIEMGAEVVGISGDQISNLQLFRRTNNLNFPLVADSDGSIARAFGVPVRDGGTITREIDGEEVTLTRDVTTARWTFIIDEDGKIAYVDTEVDASVDSEAVLAAIKKMKSDDGLGRP